MSRVFQVTGITAQQVLDLKSKILSLNGRFIGSRHFSPSCTHLIIRSDVVSSAGMSEKLMSCLVADKAVVTDEYIRRSFDANEWLDEGPFRRFVTCSSPVVGQDTGLLFRNWNVLLYMSECNEKWMMHRILKAGGGLVACDRPIRDESDCLALSPVTHVVYHGTDPFSSELKKHIESQATVFSIADVSQFVRSKFVDNDYCDSGPIVDSFLACSMDQGTSASGAVLAITGSQNECSKDATCDGPESSPVVDPADHIYTTCSQVSENGAGADGSGDRSELVLAVAEKAAHVPDDHQDETPVTTTHGTDSAPSASDATSGASDAGYSSSPNSSPGSGTGLIVSIPIQSTSATTGEIRVKQEPNEETDDRCIEKMEVSIDAGTDVPQDESANENACRKDGDDDNRTTAEIVSLKREVADATDDAIKKKRKVADADDIVLSLTFSDEPLPELPEHVMAVVRDFCRIQIPDHVLRLI